MENMMSKITELLRKAYRENNRKKRSIDTDNFEIRKDNRKQFVYEEKGEKGMTVKNFIEAYPYESYINRKEAKKILSDAGISEKELDKLIRTNETGGRDSKSTRWKKGKGGQYFYARGKETIKDTKRGRAQERAIKRYKELEEDIPF